MPTFILRRILSLIAVLLLAVTVTFCLLRKAPGDPFNLGEKQRTKEAIALEEKKYNLDGSLQSQCLRYLGVMKKSPDAEHGRPAEFSGLLQGDFGRSTKLKDRNIGELLRAIERMIGAPLPMAVVPGFEPTVLSAPPLDLSGGRGRRPGGSSLQETCSCHHHRCPNEQH